MQELLVLVLQLSTWSRTCWWPPAALPPAAGLLRGFLFLSLSSRTFPVEFPFPSARMRLEEISARSLSSSRPLRWPRVSSRSWGTVVVSAAPR